MMSTTQQQPDIGMINHGNSSMNTSAMEDSSVAPAHSQVSSSPLHHQASTTASAAATSSSSSDGMMGGLFSQEYMNMEKPSIVLQPFQFSSMMDDDNINADGRMNAASGAGTNGSGGPSPTASKPLNTTVSYCNLFESYAVEPLQSQMACISEGEDDTHSQSNKSNSTTNGSIVGAEAPRSSSEGTMGSMSSPSSFVASNPSFIASAPSFVASAHDPWATLSDRTSIITAAATAASNNSSSSSRRRSKSKNNLLMANAVSNNTLLAESSSSPEKKRSRHTNLSNNSNDTANEEEQEEGQQHPARRLRKRHAEKGAFTFRDNGEYELMMHVQRGLPPNFNRLSPLDSSNLILSVVDVYCHEEQWMFHIGQDKGQVLKAFLRECIQHKKEQHKLQYKNSMEEGEPPEMPPLILVEVGTYCGYSAILLAKSLHELDPNLKFHIYTVETNSQNIMVASSMILMSKFHENITILHHQPANESLASLMQRKLKNPPPNSISIGGNASTSTGGSRANGEAPPADFVFFDHDKERYLDHLIQFEINGIIQKGTYMAADNVLFHRLDGYRHHMRKLQRRGVTQTKMVQVSLEYCDEEDDVRDGMELTSYLKDPILRRR
mmetsp:Transcript_9886/g.23368  ORF Transcript_9886/g.23368 Transcript_9886/m.23368 type:complete len:609 (+) Transcript_9886:404-2230(+)